MVAPQMKMSGRPTKMSSQLQQKNKVISHDLKQHIPTTKLQKKTVKKVHVPTGNIRKSTLSRPKAARARKRNKHNQANQLKIVHNLDGKMGKSF